MAEGVVFTERTYGTVKMIKAAWTAGTDGIVDADYTTTETYDGKIIFAATVPGTTTPTDQYDIELTDDDGVIDLAAKNLLNRSATTTEYVMDASLGAVAKSKINIAVSNAGNGGQGYLWLYIR